METIKIKLGNLQVIIMGLNELLTKKLKSGKLVYRITRKIKELQDELKFREEARVNMCEAYCLKDSDSNPIKIDNNYQFKIDLLPVEDGENVLDKYKILDDAVMLELDNLAAFNKGIADLFESEIEVKWQPVTVEWLDANADMEYTDNILRLLDTFIIDPEEGE